MHTELTQQLLAEAKRLGFALAGVCPAVTPSGYHRLLEWIDLGYGGEMHYLRERAQAYEHPRHVLPGVRSIVMLGMAYHTDDRQHPGVGEGSVAAYAWGEADYHDLVHGRLRELRSWLETTCQDVSVRGVVDTAPLLEREFGQLAGLGWQGKNTLLLNQQFGSYFFLAALLTDLELAYHESFTQDHCGTCTACLDACPTDAFPQPYVLDARRCISYLTIEHRSEIPHELRGQWRDWLFGCDICQEVCPWNHRATASAENAFVPRPDANPVRLAELFFLTDNAFRARFRKTPLWRAKRRGVLRNAAILLGAQRDASALAALQQGLVDTEPLVRSACDWAIQQIRGESNPPGLFTTM